jgi:hypothetical protein
MLPSHVLASLVSQLAALVFAGRVAIVASAGVADGQASLRYAERDADRVASVLRELGGFDRIYQLREPGAQALREALAAVEREAAGDPNLEVVFYYSGHADDQGMLLDHERFAFAELRTRLEQSRALVRVAFLDACYAGGIVRPKGGHPAPSYTLDNVEPPHVRGAAIIAAGTASELAQESSEIEGSYFTHHMLSGLRGAGDRDGNGLVTLAEAYQYAYSHTLAATLPSVWGPQHPSYEYRLSGTGDLVMTRVGRDRRALSFPPTLAGRARAYVVSNTADEVLAEVAGRPDARVRIVLPAGRYRVIARDDSQSARAEVSVGAAPGPDVLVEAGTFQPIATELALAKGGRPGIRQELALDVTLTGLGPSTHRNPGARGGVPAAARQLQLWWPRRLRVERGGDLGRALLPATMEPNGAGLASNDRRVLGAAVGGRTGHGRDSRAAGIAPGDVAARAVRLGAHGLGGPGARSADRAVVRAAPHVERGRGSAPHQRRPDAEPRAAGVTGGGAA